jgi:hypothetical protein
MRLDHPPPQSLGELNFNGHISFERQTNLESKAGDITYHAFQSLDRQNNNFSLAIRYSLMSTSTLIPNAPFQRACPSRSVRVV